MHTQTNKDSQRIFDANTRVAIIGAGVSGLTAAYYLHQRGIKNVVVFEKERRVGGKICSYTHEGRVYEMGAVWLSKDYTVISKLMKELMHAEQHYAPVDVTDVLSISSGRARSYFRCILEDLGVITLSRELLRFAGVASKFSRAETFGFAGIPAQYHLDIESFAAQNKVDNLARLVASFVTGCGYGYYREVPTMYLMKLFPMLVKGMVKHVLGSRATLSSFPGGWQQMMEKMASYADVRLGSEVEKIVRSPDPDGRIAVTANGKTENFDRIFLSVGLHQLKDILDFSEEEAALAEAVRHYRYRVALIRGKNLPHATVDDHVVRDKIGHVTTIGRFYKDTNVYNVYQLADEQMTGEDLNRIMKEDIERIGGTVEEVIAERFWDYFPHVRRENLEGYYERFETLQGKSGTYYLGSLMNFETVETNARYSKQMIMERI